MRSSLSSLIALSGCVQYVRLEKCETHGNGNDDDDDYHDDETYPILSYPILYCGVVVCVLRAVHTCREAVAPNMSTDASPDM